MLDFLTINVQAQIAFALMLIAGLLVYIAFPKDSPHQRSDKRK